MRFGEAPPPGSEAGAKCDDVLGRIERALERDKIGWFDAWGLTPETADEVIQNYSAFLCYMTGGRLSKITYDVQTMKTIADDYQRECFESENEPVKAYIARSNSSETWYYKCGSCGHPIDPGDKFCRECGKAVRWE